MLQDLRKTRNSYNCRRTKGEYPIFFQDIALFAMKLEQKAYLSSLYGAVGMVLAKVDEKYWVPSLRTLAKREIGVIGVNFASAVKYRLRGREAK